MFGVIVLLFPFFPFELQAGITFSSQIGNVSYWSLGSTVRLPWDYDFKASDVVAEQFDFLASGSTTPKALATIGKTTTKDPRVTITDKATLSFPGAKLSDNGTYTFKVTDASFVLHSDSVMVIILEQPQAATNCSQSIEVNEGDDVICLCYNTSGNPPPTASWSKEGSSGAIGGYGYLQKLLILKNIKTSQKGKYICQVRSHTLKSEESIQVTVRSKPKIESFESGDTKGVHVAFLGRKITITCKASGDPSPSYVMSHNGTNLTDVVNGVKTIDPVNYGSAGVYKCVAVNKLGNDSDSFTLIVKEGTVTSPPTSSSTETTGGTKVGTDGEGDSGGLGTGAIVGIVVGVLFLIVVVVALVYWFCIKQNECCCACCVLGGKDDRSEDDRSQNENPAGGYVREDNPYASVDEERERPDKGASTSRNQARPAAEMPPVYAAIDKTKKNKKPPPDAQQPALTYASLDPVILQPDSSKMRDRSREETNYAAIDLEKLQSDLV